MFRLVPLTAWILAGAMLAQAQMRGPGGAPMDPQRFVQMRVDRLAEWLALSESQKSQALRIFTDAQTAAERYRQDQQTAREALQSAIKANNLAAMDRAARDIGAATAEITLIDARAEAAFYALLTSEQKQKYDQMPVRGRMPGGMSGPIPGPGGPPRPDR
ncbi:MAG: Spy/CpxP family protein refolding chaperone [Bryobacteraceae bacterium]|nr:Spy/CpxP family protein refolding chaperone [Bryobacteraceae bacterium]